MHSVLLKGGTALNHKSWFKRDPRTHFARGLKIALLGAMSSIGQPLSLLLKKSVLFDEIAIQDDNEDTGGLAYELYSIDIPGKVTWHIGKEGIKPCLKGAQIVMMVGGKVHQSNSNYKHEDIYDNCKLVYEYSKLCVSNAPDSIVCIVTGPLTSTFTVASEVFKAAQKNFHYKVIGVNTLLSIRADVALGGIFKTHNTLQVIPIVGGCTTKTSVPLISLAAPRNNISLSALIHLTQKYQNSSHIDFGIDVSDKDVSSLSEAFAASEFANLLAKSINGTSGFIENAFIMTNEVPGLPCFGLPVAFGRYGVHSTIGIPKNLNFYETGLLKTTIPIVANEINTGLSIYKKIIAESEGQVANKCPEKC